MLHKQTPDSTFKWVGSSFLIALPSFGAKIKSGTQIHAGFIFIQRI